jgi:protease-4
MTDNDGQWERAAIERLAGAALQEQRRARRWGIFFKLLTFAYITVLIVMAMDWNKGVESSDRHTALVEVSGIIGPGSDASAERVNAALQAAFKHENTKGVVLRINSPGGSPVQANAIYSEMRRLRKKHPDVPLYAVVEDLCASGGYYVAAAADRIYVDRSSIVGSIGVRMDGFGLTGLMQKLGVERRLLTAGENKGFLDPFLPVDESQQRHAKALLEQVHRHFIEAVRAGRGKRLRETPEMFSGLIWTGEKSIELGLADGFGSLDQVARDVVKAETVVDFTRDENIAERLARRLGAGVAGALLEFAVRAAPQLR